MKSSSDFLYLKSKKFLKSAQLSEIYQKLLEHFGYQHWWPGETDFEIIIGAILTQNTAWTNVEKAILNLKQAKKLDPESMKKLSHSELAELIRPAGYFNVKAKRLQHFLDFLFQNYQGDLKKMFKTPWEELRKKLLSVNGIGPETADSILLYAGRKPSFVIDAYTKRIFSRHRLLHAADKSKKPLSEQQLLALSYEEWREIFMKALPQDIRIFNDFHAQIVMLGKRFCKASKTLCEQCPLHSHL